MKTKMKMKSQLCWSCKSVNCPWRRDLKPVDGWTAKPSVTRDGLKSYQITKCPLYEHWDKQAEEDLVLHKDTAWDIQEIDENVLSRLSEKNREIIKARFIDKLLEREIAQKFGLKSSASTRHALHKAVDEYYEAKYKLLGYSVSFARGKIKALNSKALSRCPKEVRDILNLKYRDKLPTNEICAILGITIGSYHYTLKKAKRIYWGELVKVEVENGCCSRF